MSERASTPCRGRLRSIVALALLLCGCASGASPQPSPPATRTIPTFIPTAAQTPTPPASAPPDAPAPTEEPADTGWLAGERGVSMRRVRVPAPGGEGSVPLVIVRLDPDAVRLRVAYDPEQPRPLRAWVLAERPSVAINGGFFTPEYRSAALVVSDGAASGASYEGFGGMLSVAPDGAIGLRALRDEPYDPAEPLDQAAQSFPMLVLPGGVEAPFEDNGQRARRSAVAIDRAGRLLLIASPTSRLTLRDLAAWLAGSDLEIDRAMNLDGGPSTGLFVQSGDLREEIDSFSPLPIVLLIEPRSG